MELRKKLAGHTQSVPWLAKKSLRIKKNAYRMAAWSHFELVEASHTKQ